MTTGLLTLKRIRLYSSRRLSGSSRKYYSYRRLLYRVHVKANATQKYISLLKTSLFYLYKGT